jgi:hypothetical protein
MISNFKVEILAEIQMPTRVARFFFVQYINQSGEKNVPNDYKITKCPLNIPNGCKIFQMTRIFNYIIHSKVLPNTPKLVFLVRRETIWQP